LTALKIQFSLIYFILLLWKQLTCLQTPVYEYLLEDNNLEHWNTLFLCVDHWLLVMWNYFCNFIISFIILKFSTWGQSALIRILFLPCQSEYSFLLWSPPATFKFSFAVKIGILAFYLQRELDVQSLDLQSDTMRCSL
jgi:hypothetical protein